MQAAPEPSDWLSLAHNEILQVVPVTRKKENLAVKYIRLSVKMLFFSLSCGSSILEATSVCELIACVLTVRSVRQRNDTVGQAAALGLEEEARTACFLSFSPSPPNAILLLQACHLIAFLRPLKKEEEKRSCRAKREQTPQGRLLLSLLSFSRKECMAVSSLAT